MVVAPRSLSPVGHPFLRLNYSGESGRGEVDLLLFMRSMISSQLPRQPGDGHLDLLRFVVVELCLRTFDVDAGGGNSGGEEGTLEGGGEDFLGVRVISPFVGVTLCSVTSSIHVRVIRGVVSQESEALEGCDERSESQDGRR